MDGPFCRHSQNHFGRFEGNSRTTVDFEINTDSLEITVQYQNGNHTVRWGQNVDEFPQPAAGHNCTPYAVEMDAQVLLGNNRAVFATADDELRPVMNGIYFDITTEDITMVASDGHKLVRCKTLAAKVTNVPPLSCPEAGFADEESAAERTRHGDYRVRRTQTLCSHWKATAWCAVSSKDAIPTTTL